MAREPALHQRAYEIHKRCFLKSFREQKHDPGGNDHEHRGFAGPTQDLPDCRFHRLGPHGGGAFARSAEPAT